jgi:hypothetical protein
MGGNKSNDFDAGEAIELWNNGIPLDRAADAFGNVSGQSKIRRVALDNANASAIAGKANFQKVGIDADAFLDALAPVEASLSANAQIRVAKEDRLFARLRSGELVAFGFPVHKEGAVDPGPVPIFLFDRSFAKWRKRSFVGHGRHYADVRICPSILRAAERDAPTLEQDVGRDDGTIIAKRGGGRRSLYPLAKTVLDELFRNPVLVAKAAEPLLDPFNRIYVARFSTPDRKAAAVSERALREYLKRYRQELAETGNN